MMKNKILSGMATIAVLFLFISGVLAFERSSPAVTGPELRLGEFAGVIEKVDQANKEILVELDGRAKTFYLDDHTKITVGIKELSFIDLKKGMWASLEYRIEGSGLVAESVHVGVSSPLSRLR